MEINMQKFSVTLRTYASDITTIEMKLQYKKFMLHHFFF